MFESLSLGIFVLVLSYCWCVSQPISRLLLVIFVFSVVGPFLGYNTGWTLGYSLFSDPGPSIGTYIFIYISPGYMSIYPDLVGSHSPDTHVVPPEESRSKCSLPPSVMCPTLN